jgi:hypothetical protein
MRRFPDAKRQAVNCDDDTLSPQLLFYLRFFNEVRRTALAAGRGRARWKDIGAYPDNVSAEKITKIESEVTNLQKIGASLFASMEEHPTLGTVLILNKDDDSGGFVLVDRVKFI